MYECGKLKKVIGNKSLFPVILEQCEKWAAGKILGPSYYETTLVSFCMLHGSIF